MKLGSFGRGDENSHLSFTSTPICWAPMWDHLRSQGLEGTSAGSFGRGDENSHLSFTSTPICWAPMWDNYVRQKELLSV